MDFERSSEALAKQQASLGKKFAQLQERHAVAGKELTQPAAQHADPVKFIESIQLAVARGNYEAEKFAGLHLQDGQTISKQDRLNKIRSYLKSLDLLLSPGRLGQGQDIDKRRGMYIALCMTTATIHKRLAFVLDELAGCYDIKASKIIGTTDPFIPAKDQDIHANGLERLRKGIDGDLGRKLVELLAATHIAEKGAREPYILLPTDNRVAVFTEVLKIFRTPKEVPTVQIQVEQRQQAKDADGCQRPAGALHASGPYCPIPNCNC